MDENNFRVYKRSVREVSRRNSDDFFDDDKADIHTEKWGKTNRIFR